MRKSVEDVDRLAERIIKYRARHNLNQEQFAFGCGLTKQTIYAIENGKRRITNLTFAKIENVLDREEEVE